MPGSRMLSFWFLHWVARVVEFQALLGPPCFDIFSSGIQKHKYTLRISYTIVLPRRNVPVVRIIPESCTVLSSIITVKLQKQIENDTVFLSVQEL